jgi:phosphatidylglycerophosphatase A
MGRQARAAVDGGPGRHVSGKARVDVAGIDKGDHGPSAAVLIATVGGLGRVPFAAGTLGTLAAVPLVLALAALRVRSPAAYGAAVVGVLALAVWSAGRAELALGGHDHSAIVIDEVAGFVAAAAFLPATWTATALAFVLFRVFDIVKPFPASVFDRRIRGGLGVVGDDIVAGLFAGLAAWLVLRWWT